MTLTGQGHDGGLDVELYCRTRTTTATAVDGYHDDLERLRSMGAVESIEVTGWSSRVELRASNDAEAAEAYREFTEWARSAGVRLEPAFNVRDYESEFTGEKGTALITPVACVAAYDDDELIAVYPHVDGDDVVTVEDGIEELKDEWCGESPTADETLLAGEPAE